MSTSPKHLVVIGAGPGGLAAAMLLSARGFKVTVLEKQGFLGGRNSETSLGGKYRFDTGPTFLMMKYLLDEVFQEAGRRIEDYLDCRRIDPMYKLFFDKKSMVVQSDPNLMAQEIERVFPGESAGLAKFHSKEAKRFEALYPCLQKNYGTLTSFFSSQLLAAFPYIAAGRSLYDVLSDYFRSEELRLAFTFQAKYLGMSPWECPGLFAMIPYTEHAHGIYHVMGGLCKISEAFAKVAEEHGAQIRLNAPVKRVLLEKRKAIGVELENGEKIFSDDVIINADFGHAMKTLFPPTSLKKHSPKALAKRKYSCSTFMMYLGLDKTFDADFHTILFAKNYQENLKDISERLVLSNDISCYVRNASILDPTLAPEGHSALYILVPVPNNRSKIDWETQKPLLREQILDMLKSRSQYGDIRPHIREELILTPQDWESKLSVYEGATFNLGHQLSQMMYLRPHNEFEEFSNTYLVGGGTHPGSGLPTIFESARISTNLICKKYKMPVPSPKGFKEIQEAQT